MTNAQVVTKRPSSRGAARKKSIIEAATRMFARTGSRGTTLGEIAAEVGVSQAAVVYHFGTKEELLNAVLDNRDRFEDTQLWRNGPDPGLDIFWIVADIVRVEDGKLAEHCDVLHDEATQSSFADTPVSR